MAEFSQELFDRICERISEGESLRAICEDADMPNKANVLRWVAADDALRDQYARAMETRADVHFEEMLAIADSPMLGEIVTVKDDGKTETRTEDMLGHRRLQVDTRKWILARMNPRKYGEKLELAGDKENPLTLQVLTGVPRSED